MSLGARVRALLGYVPILLKVIIAIVFGVLIFAGYRAASAASFFQIRTVEIQGDSRASAKDVQAIVKREVSQTGVWQADLRISAANSSACHGSGLRWSRVFCQTEYEFALLSANLAPSCGLRLAVSSGLMRMPCCSAKCYRQTSCRRSFCAVGMRTREKQHEKRIASESESSLRCVVTGMPRACRQRVSEVNLIDLRDVRAQLAGDDSQIEIRLGSQDLGKRLKQALEVLDEQRNTPRGSLISYIDLNQGKGAIVGFVSGAHRSTNTANRPTEERQKTTESDRDDPEAGTKICKGKEKRAGESKSKRSKYGSQTASGPTRLEP